uniref:Nudix hydrolase domain-containing protein n=1 Tax=Syphacia muris TaxID=451379 RepID=A0A0N5AM04_9BILA
MKIVEIIRQSSTIPCFSNSLREQFVRRIKGNVDLTNVKHKVKKILRVGNSAVLVPLLNIDSMPYMLFTQRSLLLTGHRGQICFPGGRVDHGETAEMAAIRECYEEIGLTAESVEIWGQLRPLYTKNLENVVTPVVGFVHGVDKSTLNVHSDEVRSVFAVPVEELCSSPKYTRFRGSGETMYDLPVFNCRRFQKIFFEHPSPTEYRIWGLTAGIVHLALLNLFPLNYRSSIQLLHPKDCELLNMGFKYHFEASLKDD